MEEHDRGGRKKARRRKEVAVVRIEWGEKSLLCDENELPHYLA